MPAEMVKPKTGLPQAMTFLLNKEPQSLILI
jgi:hypothetical protein